MTRIAWILVTVVLIAPVAAETKDEAARLADEAKVLMSQCTSKRDCPTFADATAKLVRAYGLRPDPEFAELYCDLAPFGPQLTEARSVEVVALCDVALQNTPSNSNVEMYLGNVRKLRGGRGWTTSAGDAARALYGVGLVAKEGSPPTLAYGAVTAERMQGFIRDHYVGVVATGDDLRQPARKLAACKAIAASIADAGERTKVIDFCEIETAREHTSNFMAFGGPTGTAPIKLEAAKRVFQIDAKLHYEPTFVLRTSESIRTAATVPRARELAQAIVAKGAAHSYAKEAAAMVADLDAYVEKRRLAAARIAKDIAAHKSRISFQPYAPKDWDVPELLNGHHDTCKRVYLETAEQGETELVVTVDGKPCQDDYSVSAQPSTDCPELLEPAGRHTIAATLYRVTWVKDGSKRVTVHSKDSIDIRDNERSSRKGKLASGQLTCGG
jgi:hypothetical protein